MLKFHIQTVELSSAQATISFNSIPQDFTDLYVLYSTRSVADNQYITWTGFNVRANGIASGYSGRMLEGNGVSAYSQTNAADTQWAYAASPDSATTANTFSNGSIYIPNYSGFTTKSYSMDRVTENNATQSSQLIYAGLLNNTAPITSLAFIEGVSNFAIGTSISLYGVKRGSDGRTEVAAGGVITTSGGYTIHTFNTSGTFVANRDLNVETLVIGGGGGGGGSSNTSPAGAGAGGAGGYRSSVSGESSGGGAAAEDPLFVSSGSSHVVSIGSGGVGAANNASVAGDGSNSFFNSITAIGGGGGGSQNTGFQNGRDGGSGGGVGNGSTSNIIGSGTTNQGFAGGISNNPGTNGNAGAGGGGAGSAGSNFSVGNGGNGGAGVSSSISGLAVARGGGGAGGGASYAGTATDGGGNGAIGTNTPGAGTDNTGGGGGSRSGGAGANGGSGVVIIRYLTP